MSRIFEVRIGWFGRWHVYEVGSLLGDATWVATFKYPVDMQRFTGRLSHGEHAPTKNGEKK